MIAGPISSITAEAIDALVTDASPESPTLDFKREAPAKSDAGRTEFLKDVCALANFDGGDLVYGVASTNDVASKVIPITNEVADPLKRRLTTWLNSEVEPRVSFEMREVAMPQGGFALIVRVPQSFAGPHWYRAHGAKVTDHHRFAIRSGTTTADMDYTQVRNAFDRTSSLVERARGFRASRMALIEESRFPLPMGEGPKCVFHVIPLAGLLRPELINIAETYRAAHSWTLPKWNPPQRVVNLDGLLMRLSTQPGGAVPGYIQLYRSGAMEVVQIGDAQWVKPERAIPAAFVSVFYRAALKLFTDRARDLRIFGPALIGAAFTSVDGYKFAVRQFGDSMMGDQPDRPHLVLPEQLIDDLGTEVPIDQLARPMLDTLWQGFGEVECQMYGADGVFDPSWRG